jgi:hypothetical protein
MLQKFLLQIVFYLENRVHFYTVIRMIIKIMIILFIYFLNVVFCI